MDKGEAIDPSLVRMVQQSDQPFKQALSFQERFVEYQILRCNYPGLIPLSCQLQNYTGSKKVGIRMFICEDILVGHFKALVKKLLMSKFSQVRRSDNIFLMVQEDVIIKYDIPLREVYKQKRQKDGWLHIRLSVQN